MDTRKRVICTLYNGLGQLEFLGLVPPPEDQITVLGRRRIVEFLLTFHRNDFDLEEFVEVFFGRQPDRCQAFFTPRGDIRSMRAVKQVDAVEWYELEGLPGQLRVRIRLTLNAPLRTAAGFTFALANRITMNLKVMARQWEREAEAINRWREEAVPVECDECSWGAFAASKEDFLENRGNYQQMHNEARPNCTGAVELGIF